MEALTPLLAEYQVDNSGLRLELSISEHNEDLLRREAGLAIPMQRPQPATLLACRLGCCRLGLYAHRNYLAQNGPPNTH